MRARGRTRWGLAPGTAPSLTPAVGITITVASAAVFVTTFAVAWTAWTWDYARAWDTPVYYGYADRIADGAVPYRDVRLEYPPGAVPLFVLPRWAVGDATGVPVWEPVEAIDDDARRYGLAFAALMILGGLVAIVAVSVALWSLGRPLVSWLAAQGALALSPLVLGGLLYTRYDVWPAALTAVAVALALRKRPSWSCCVLGVATAMKLYPAVLLPLLLVYAWRRAGGRRAAIAAGAFAAALALVLAPAAIVAPGELARTMRTQVARGLQVESTPAAALAAASGGAWKVGLLDERFARVVKNPPGLVTAELQGSGALALGVLSTALVGGVILGVFAASIRRPLPDDELVRLAAVSVVAVLALGRVLSPQFVVWLIPLVPLVAGRRGVGATALLLGVMGTTHAWFPTLYRDYVNTLRMEPTAFLLLRNALLVALLVVLVWPRRANARVAARA